MVKVQAQFKSFIDMIIIVIIITTTKYDATIFTVLIHPWKFLTLKHILQA